MLTSMRNIVTNKAIRPGTLSTGMRNAMNEMKVSNPVGKKTFTRKGVRYLANFILNPVKAYVSLPLMVNMVITSFSNGL